LGAASHLCLSSLSKITDGEKIMKSQAYLASSLE